MAKRAWSGTKVCAIEAACLSSAADWQLVLLNCEMSQSTQPASLSLTHRAPAHNLFSQYFRREVGLLFDIFFAGFQSLCSKVCARSGQGRQDGLRRTTDGDVVWV